ncbi:MAG: transketolase [Chloroflexi bacterium HGW-Chloroflexi-3]|nr:MAG: transketolase [Chloroflexi bacterium HGW-Chloroflexi-3]
MEQIIIKIEHPVGLHARPATLFVDTIKKFKSSVRLRKNDREVNAKSILSVLSLGVKQSDEITIVADGDDATQVLSELKVLINGNFGEETVHDKPKTTPKPIATRDAFGKAILALGEQDERVVVLSGDLADSTRVLKFSERFPDRFFEMGISEQDLIGTSAGLALRGKIPFVATYAVFGVSRAFDQIRMSVCYTNANVKLAFTHAGLSVGEDGGSAMTLEDLALMCSLPHMTVVVPADAGETEAAVRAAATWEGPVYLRLGRSGVPVLDPPDENWVFGKARLYRKGSDITIAACGIMVSVALEAAEICEKQGISLEVINFHTLKPFDGAALVESARRTGRVITAEEHNIFGGLGSIAARVLGEQYPTPMRFIAVRDSFGESGKPEELMEKYGLTANDIVKAAGDLMKK